MERRNGTAEEDARQVTLHFGATLKVCRGIEVAGECLGSSCEVAGSEGCHRALGQNRGETNTEEDSARGGQPTLG
jgi:hypothetical protein